MKENKWSEYFRYDESSPTCLRWAVTRYWGRNMDAVRVYEGDVAGYRHKEGYYQVEVDGIGKLTHRVVWEMFNPELGSEDVIDHKDGNTSNGRIGNLRLATGTVNARNRRKRADNTSGLTGVRKMKNHSDNWYWVAQWRTLEGKQTSCYFSVEKLGEEAARNAAIACRTSAVSEMNTAGAGYTERHGT